MALSRCRECGKSVSSAARVCPHCGRPYPTFVAERTVLIWVIFTVLGLFALFIGLAVGGCFGQDK